MKADLGFTIELEDAGVGGLKITSGFVPWGDVVEVAIEMSAAADDIRRRQRKMRDEG